MRRLLAAALVAMATTGCTDPNATTKTLLDAGYTDIEVVGYDAWSCGKGDTYCTEFRAKGPTGRKVRGAVGCGLMTKGCTIRLKN